MAEKKAKPGSQTGKKQRVEARSATKSGSKSGASTKSGGKSGSSRSKQAASSKKAAPSSTAWPRLSRNQKDTLFGIFILFVTAVLAVSLLAPQQGRLTAFLSDMMAQLFGLGRYLVPLLTGGIGLYLVLRGMEQPPTLPTYRLIGLGLLVLVALTFASMFVVRRDETLESFWTAAAAGRGGGYVGAVFATLLTGLLGEMGAMITLILIGFVGAALATGVTRRDVADLFRRAPAGASGTSAPPVADRPIRMNPGRSPVAPAPTATPEATQLPLLPSNNRKRAPAAGSSGKKLDKPTHPPRRETAPTGGRPESAASPVYLGKNSQVQTSPVDGATWSLPRMADILEPGSDLDLNNAAIREQVETIEHTLESFGAPVTVVEINQGPTITQFGVEPNYISMRGGKRTKVKVGKIAGLADDLALALAARSIRIQAPVPGKGYVGIEVPNSAKALVSLRDVMESSEFGRLKSALRIGLGQNVAGQPIVADLAAMPHLLIAGTTGSGKSVCVNAIIACLLLQNTPDDLRIVMVDPKRVELTGYNGVPHLAAPVVVDMDRVIGTLQWALREMDNRYKLFAGMGARNIAEYNKRIAQRGGEQRLPYIVFIIDELADLMMLAPEDTERAVTRLAQMARATGIHMVIATQRPSVDVVTGLIKANFPARIAFAVATGTDSRVILDSTGAERLLGQGDMLFQSPDAAAPLRLQGCFVSDGELHKLIAYWQTARRAQVIPAASSVQPRPADRPTASGGPSIPPPIVTMQPPEAAPATSSTNRAAAVPPSAPEAAARPATRPTSSPPPTQPQPQRPADTMAAPSPEPFQQPLWEALEEMGNNENGGNGTDDELLPEAIALVRKLNKASTSLLQRRFRIGYTRAARLMDALEEQGVIGPPTGTSKAREVYPTDGQAGSEPLSDNLNKVDETDRQSEG